MKCRKFILAVLIIFAACSFGDIYAQNPKSPQKILLSKDKNSPFTDGETVIVEVKFTGLDSDYERYDGAIYEKEFLSDLSESRAQISVDEKFNSRKIEQVIKFLKKWLADKSYLKAEVVALGEKLPNNRMKLVFSVKRGAEIRVSEIRFAGNVNITTQEYVDDFKQCSGNSWEKFDKRKYDYYSHKCPTELMFSKGYFKARVKGVTPRLVADNYVVTVEVEEGVRYRIGEIEIEGAKVFTNKEILEMAELKTGDVADGKALKEFLYEKLKRNYADKGYVLYNAEFDVEYIKPLAEGLDATVDILLTIDEGKAFKVGQIKFVGVEKEESQQLKETFSLKEGEIYNQSKFEDGIKKINETKEFYIADNDSNSEMLTNEESGEVWLVIKVYKIQ